MGSHDQWAAVPIEPLTEPLWAWHAPPLFNRALGHPGWHIAQHATFLLTALIFWWAILQTPNRGLAALCLFLTSIIGGTLPLELFGRNGYGARLGWIGSARTFASALAPYALALLLGRVGTETGLWIVAASAAFGIAAFGVLALSTTRSLGRPVTDPT